jgi:hypothetical protein
MDEDRDSAVEPAQALSIWDSHHASAARLSRRRAYPTFHTSDDDTAISEVQ